MLSYNASYNSCSDCFNTSRLLEKVDHAIYLLGRRIYRNRVLLDNSPIDKEKLKLLIYYRPIVENLMYNPYYYQMIDYQRIDSRIKELVNGLH